MKNENQLGWEILQKFHIVCKQSDIVLTVILYQDDQRSENENNKIATKTEASDSRDMVMHTKAHPNEMPPLQAKQLTLLTGTFSCTKLNCCIINKITKRTVDMLAETMCQLGI